MRSRFRTGVVAAVSMGAMVLPSTTVPGFSSTTGGDEAPAPAGFDEVTDTDRGRREAAAMADRSRDRGSDAGANDFRVYARGDELLVAHRALAVQQVARETTDNGTGVQLVSEMSHASVAEAAQPRERQPVSSAEASHGPDSHTEQGSGSESNCYGAWYSSTYLTFYDCYRVTYKGYSNGYYYFAVEQETLAKGKDAGNGYAGYIHRAYARYDQNYGLSWAGPDAQSPQSQSTKNCASLTLSVSGGPFSASRPVEWCDTWTPDWDPFAAWYINEWTGGVSKQWRSVDYILMLRKYRCQCWKATFTSYADYSVVPA